MTSGWCKGTCERTGKTGDFPSEAVYVLPTMDHPTAEVLVRFIILIIIVRGILIALVVICGLVSLASAFL